MGVDALAATTGRTREEVSAALAALALSGIVGYDLAEGGFFRRELPFDLGRTERLQPRLRAARRLVEQGAVRIDTAGSRSVAAWVAGAGGVEYRVRSTADGWTCTCPWYGRHRGDRGPCKHVLAVQLVGAPMTPAEALRAAGRAGDEAAVRDLLADLSETERATWSRSPGSSSRRR